MSSYREERGVAGLSPDERRAQWNARFAQRIMQNRFASVRSDNGESVIVMKGDREKEYMKNPNALIEAYYDYYQDIVSTNEAGIAVTPDIEDFCLYAQISRQGLMRCYLSSNMTLVSIIEDIRNDIAAAKKQLAFSGQIPPVVMAIDFNNNHDYVQARTEMQIMQRQGDAKEGINDIASRLIDVIEENPMNTDI